MEKSESKNQRPSFIKIARGAKVDGLSMINNTGVGDADFINNEGELKNANFEGNKHIIPGQQSPRKVWWKRPEIVIPIIIGLISIPWWPDVLALLGGK